MRHITKMILLVAATAAVLSAQIDPPGRVGRLNYIEGSVSFQPAGINDWVDASVNRPLIAGDYIWVGDRGRSELHVGSAALRLGPNTAFEFLNLDDQGVQIRLSEGTLTVRVRSLDRNQIFEVDTPNVAFTLSRPGEYRIDANPDSQSTIITVRDGEGEVTGGGESFPVYARQRVIVQGDDRIDYRLSSASSPDSWDQWCSTRDRREDQSQSARYVSREVAGYDDLDQYGRWDNQPGYGNVWMPTSVGIGWAPYHDGHWAWIAPWGWTWVDDAPWGFAPYHYGRWASFGGRWGWIPGPYGVTPIYAPALVAWVGGSGFSLSFSIGTAAAVGWFPLGPREPYFPSYQASRDYFTRVNTTNTVINTTIINNYYDSGRSSNNTPITNITYVNQGVPNGVTAVPRDSFARGRRVTQDARPVPSSQLSSTQVFGAPAVAPQRESVLGSRADTASRAARPPANVLSRPVVARTPPPPAPVPFERQQPGLARNPGRPLPTADVQQIRQAAPAPSAPVRVVDMGRVRRVQQPAVGAAPQAPPSPVPQPSVVERQKGSRERQQQDAAPPEAIAPQPPNVERQKGRQQFPQREPPPQQVTPQATPPAIAPQPPIVERQKGRQEPPQAAPVQAAPAQAPTPPPAVIERQKGRRQEPPQQPQQQQLAPPQAATPQATPPAIAPQPPIIERQKGRQEPPQAAPVQAAPAQAPTPPPAVIERQKGRRQEPPQQPAPPPAAPPPAPAPPAAVPAPAAQPPSEPQQNRNKGKQQKAPKDEDNKNKSDR